MPNHGAGRSGLAAQRQRSLATISGDQRQIVTAGFTPLHGPVSVPDGRGGTLRAWIATCDLAGDGQHCQKVFFFDGSRFLGNDRSSPSNQIDGISPSGIGAISVQYATYRANDPLCCPSGTPVTVRFLWSGSSLRSSPSG